MIEGDWDFIAVGDAVLFEHHRGQAGESCVANWINQLVDLLALKQRLEGFTVMVLCVLKFEIKLARSLKKLKSAQLTK